MQAKIERRTRLDRRDWLDAALPALVHGGIAAVAIEKLASGLRVTRGSFYHHFRDRADLLDELLEYWAQSWTVAIRDDAKALGLDPRNTLLALTRMIHHREAAKHDVAFRAWALHDEKAREVVARVDEIRLNYIRSLFLAMGFQGVDAENRTRLALYYEMAEPAMFDSPSEELMEQLMVERHKFLTAAADD